MARQAVVDAVTTRLATLGVPMSEPVATTETPADASNFVVVQFPVSTTRRMTVTEPLYQEEGSIRFVLHTSSALGIDGATPLADDIADLFGGQTFSGVRCLAPSSPRFDDSNDQGNYFQSAIICPYVHYFNG